MSNTWRLFYQQLPKAVFSVGLPADSHHKGLVMRKAFPNVICSHVNIASPQNFAVLVGIWVLPRLDGTMKLKHQ